MLRIFSAAVCVILVLWYGVTTVSGGEFFGPRSSKTRDPNKKNEYRQRTSHFFFFHGGGGK